MLRQFLFTSVFVMSLATIQAQDPVTAANKFINVLDKDQKGLTLFPFDIDERFNFHFFPKERKGISLEKLTPAQREAAFELLKTCMSEQGAKKSRDIIELEGILRDAEGRPANDTYRDPGKYYITIFGIPGSQTIWGWRLEGHHLSLNFSARENKLVSGTPGFMGANPAIVQEGPRKGTQVLKEETEMGYALLNSFSSEQLKKVIFNEDAPGDIITFVDRKASIERRAGISYAQMNEQQKQLLLQLIRVYVYRYTKSFADNMLKEIQTAGLDELWFGWAGDTKQGIGHPHYYRIHGPTIIIEYDNTQGRGNHIHSVVRDLKNDFGGDLLLNHYREEHSPKKD
jgi:hypothetical protein